MELYNLCLLENFAFLASKTLLSLIGIEKIDHFEFFINFELYDLTNGKE
jgi:hypothetical protein